MLLFNPLFSSVSRFYLMDMPVYCCLGLNLSFVLSEKQNNEAEYICC